jgi:PPOX class probable F420-dependent enzyme
MAFTDEQRAFLDRCRVGRLGTIAPDGRPHLVPVCYAAVGERIAIAIDEKPKRTTELARVRNIRRDPRVTLLVDEYSDDWERLAWRRIDGTAEVLNSGRVWPEAVAALRARYAPYERMGLEDLPVIVITTTKIVEWQWQSR